MSGVVLIDLNNIGYRAQQAGRPLVVGDMQVHAIYGVLRSVRMIVSNFSVYEPIVLYDGVSWRKSFYEGYKANRNEVRTKADERKIADRKSYHRQRPYITKALLHLGVRQASASNLEADDLAALMVRKLAPTGRRVLLVTADRDWLQLVRHGVSWFDPINNLKITNSTFTEKTGFANTRALLEAKALSGDTADEIPGVGAIGEKGAAELLAAFGSVGSFLNQYADGTLTDVPSKYKSFAESDEKQIAFRRNMQLMDLNDPRIPEPYNYKLIHRPMNKPALEELFEELAFRSILKDLDSWCEPFERKLP